MSNPPSYSQVLSKKNVETQPPGPLPESTTSDESKAQCPSDSPLETSVASSDVRTGSNTPLSGDTPRPPHSKGEISALEESIKALNLAAPETVAADTVATNGATHGGHPAPITIAQRPVVAKNIQILPKIISTSTGNEQSAAVPSLQAGGQFDEAIPFANQLPDLPVTRIDGPSEEPDERLITALDNPRDRYFILKFEQEAYTFVQKKTCLELQVPPMNSYHRLLVHQLAEYYRLTHVSDEKGSITLRVSEHTRIPTTRLQDIAEAKGTGQDTPPAGATVKKIMRRNPSKNGAGDGSEAGSEKGGNGGDSQKQQDGKSSREEREALYQAARQRIFGDFKESTDAQPAKKPEKTTPKKHVQDDDFSDRNQFVPLAQAHYYPQQHYQQPAPPPFNAPWPATAPLQQPTSTRPNAAAPVWSPGVTGYGAPTGPPRAAEYPQMPNSQYHQSYNTPPQPPHQHRPAYPGPPSNQPQYSSNNFIPPQVNFQNKNQFNHSFPSSAVSTPPPMNGIARPPTVPPTAPQSMYMGNMGNNAMGNPSHLHIGNSAMQRGHSMNSSFKPNPAGPPSGPTYGGYANNNNAMTNFPHPSGMPNHGMTSPTMYNNSVHNSAPQNTWNNSAWQQQPWANNSTLPHPNHVNIGNGAFNNQQKPMPNLPGPWNGQPSQFNMNRQ